MTEEPIWTIDKYAGSRLKEIREAHDMTQADVGKALGVTGPAIMKKEKGMDSISINQLAALSVMFKVPVSYFFEDSQDLNKITAANRRIVKAINKVITDLAKELSDQ